MNIGNPALFSHYDDVAHPYYYSLRRMQRTGEHIRMTKRLEILQLNKS